MKNTTKRTIKIIVRAITFFSAILTFPVGIVLTILAAGTFDYIAKYNTGDPEPWGLLIVGGVLLFASLINILVYDMTWKKK